MFVPKPNETLPIGFSHQKTDLFSNSQLQQLWRAQTNEVLPIGASYQKTLPCSTGQLQSTYFVISFRRLVDDEMIADIKLTEKHRHNICKISHRFLKGSFEALTWLYCLPPSSRWKELCFSFHCPYTVTCFLFHMGFGFQQDFYRVTIYLRRSRVQFWLMLYAHLLESTAAQQTSKNKLYRADVLPET